MCYGAHGKGLDLGDIWPWLLTLTFDLDSYSVLLLLAPGRIFGNIWLSVPKIDGSTQSLCFRMTYGLMRHMNGSCASFRNVLYASTCVFVRVWQASVRYVLRVKLDSTNASLRQMCRDCGFIVSRPLDLNQISSLDPGTPRHWATAAAAFLDDQLPPVDVSDPQTFIFRTSSKDCMAVLLS